MKVMTLTGVAMLATASMALAGTHHYPIVDTNQKTQEFGTVEAIDEAPPMVSFAPMPPDRERCDPKQISSTTSEPPRYSSFERLPKERLPVVARVAKAETVQTAQVITEPAPIPSFEPLPEPEPAPVVIEPIPEQLPATGSLIPLVGLIGLISVAGATVLRVARRA